MRIKQSGRLLIIGVLLCLWVGTIAVPGMTHAAPDQQAGGTEISLLDPQDGTLNSTRTEDTYTFRMNENFVFSATSWTRSGDIVTDITVFGPGGQVIAEDTLSGGDESNRAIEGVIAPTSGTYSITVRLAKGTSGEYGLLLLPGYSYIEKYDDFESDSETFSFAWEDSSSDASTTGVVNGALQIHVIAEDTLTYKTPADEFIRSDIYVESQVTIEGSPSYAEFGFALRLNPDTQQFYALTFSSEGDWSLSYYDNGWTNIQEWTKSPAIDASDTTPRIGVFLQGSTFRVYYNDKYVGQVTDTNNFLSEGRVGLVAATAAEQTEGLVVFHDNLVITTPGVTGATAGTTDEGQASSGIAGILGTATAMAGGGDGDSGQTVPIPFGQATPIGQASPPPTNTPLPPPPTNTPLPPPPTNTPLPPPPTNTPLPTIALPTEAPCTRLVNWQGTPSQIVGELQQCGLAPAGGSVILNIGNSFGETTADGFNYYPLGRGRQFRNFVLAFDSRLDAGADDAMCGMHFRASSISVSRASVAANGSVFLAQVNEDGIHDSSVLMPSSAVRSGIGSTNKVIVVAVEDRLTMFVNGEQVASGTFTIHGGTVALEVYVPEDDFGNTQRTYCQLNAIWLWEF
jgi:hypothetical protein